jgi:uncharacterized membrane protein YdjX (TVP38/TMEM64 family)
MLKNMLLEQVKHFVQQDPQLTAVYLIIAKIIGAILLFPGTPLTLLAGATLGVFWGSIVSVIGNTLGATAAFLISRFFLRTYVTTKLYGKYPLIQTYESRFFHKGLLTVILLRLIPLFPFNVLNYLLGITKVTTKDYIIGTGFGIIPGTIAFVYFGNAITMLSPFHIISSVIAIVGLTYIGKYYEKKYK